MTLRRSIRIALSAAALFAGAAFAVQASEPGAPGLAPKWVVSGLDSPESVLDAGDGTFFVSNVNGEGDVRDGNGYIARISADGRLIEQKWVTGLDAPKGMALSRGFLFVADITHLVVIDVAKGEIAGRVPFPDAGFLNDVTLGPAGEVLVADSARQRIYVYDGKAVKVWLEDPLLRSVNGLLPERDRLVITTMQGRLLARSWTEPVLVPLAEGLGNADGVARLGDGTYLVSEWPGRLFHVRADGSNTVVEDTREQQRFWNDFLLVGDTLLVPNWKPGEVSAYRVTYPARGQ